MKISEQLLDSPDVHYYSVQVFSTVEIRCTTVLTKLTEAMQIKHHQYQVAQHRLSNMRCKFTADAIS